MANNIVVNPERNVPDNSRVRNALHADSKKSVGVMINELLDSNKLRNRFDELLGKRTPQFISSLISVVSGDSNLTKALYEDPMSVIKSGLQAASYDLPIDSALGYAYIVPFNNTVKDEYGNPRRKTSATFILGYKGIYQLALRTGEYEKINVTDVREGEYKGRNRLSGDVEFEFIDDDAVRSKLKVVGYAAYYRLKTKFTAMLYSTVEEIEEHEKKFRKGQYQTKGWRENFDVMARKTVLRALLGKWGILSIDYRSAAATQKLMEAATAPEGGEVPPDADYIITPEGAVISDTGEVVDIPPEETAKEPREEKKGRAKKPVAEQAEIDDSDIFA